MVRRTLIALSVAVLACFRTSSALMSFVA